MNDDRRNENKLYTITDITEMLSVKRPTVHEWIRSGKLKAVRIGKEYRITQEHYDEYLANNLVVTDTKKKR